MLPYIHPSICAAEGAMERVFWKLTRDWSLPEGYKKKFSSSWESDEWERKTAFKFYNSNKNKTAVSLEKTGVSLWDPWIKLLMLAALSWGGMGKRTLLGKPWVRILWWDSHGNRGICNCAEWDDWLTQIQDLGQEESSQQTGQKSRKS